MDRLKLAQAQAARHLVRRPCERWGELGRADAPLYGTRRINSSQVGSVAGLGTPEDRDLEKEHMSAALRGEKELDSQFASYGG